MGSSTILSGLAPNHGLVADTTKPHLVVLMFGEDSFFIPKYSITVFLKVSPGGSKITMKFVG